MIKTNALSGASLHLARVMSPQIEATEQLLTSICAVIHVTVGSGGLMRVEFRKVYVCSTRHQSHLSSRV